MQQLSKGKGHIAQLNPNFSFVERDAANALLPLWNVTTSWFLEF